MRYYFLNCSPAALFASTALPSSTGDRPAEASTPPVWPGFSASCSSRRRQRGCSSLTVLTDGSSRSENQSGVSYNQSRKNAARHYRYVPYEVFYLVYSYALRFKDQKEESISSFLKSHESHDKANVHLKKSIMCLLQFMYQKVRIKRESVCMCR